MKMTSMYRLTVIFLVIAIVYAFWKFLLIAGLTVAFIRVVYGVVAGETSR